MGLPMFQEPDDVIAEDAASKLDRAASHQRSTIRRQATVRPGRYNLSERERDREREIERRAQRNLEASLERLRSIRSRTQSHNRSDRLIERQYPSLRDYVSYREATDLLRQAGRDPWNSAGDGGGSGGGEENEGATRSSSPSRRQPWATSETAVRVTVSAPRAGSRSGISPHRLRMLTPPTSSESGPNVPDGRALDGAPGEPGEPGEPDGPSQTGRPSLFTPGFAPARGPYRDRPPPPEEEDIPTPPPESLNSEIQQFPSLRRVGHLSPRPARMDGLGDRRRSLSPDAEEETWVTLLTTMNDTRPSNNTNSSNSNISSSATSFASSVGRPRSSQQSTNATSTSFGEIGQLDDGCDLDLPSGITEDDVREIREEHRRERRRREPREPDGPISTAIAVAAAAAARATAEASAEQGLLRQLEQRRTRRVELNLFQDILERMQRREDIPDEWWAAVGLTPIT